MADSFLIFKLHSVSYALQASTVGEILWLPELTPIAEAPAYLAGVVNRRGKILPVMDLSICLGEPRRFHQVNDCVIVLETPAGSAGIIVNDVHEVRQIPAAEREPAAAYGQSHRTSSPLIQDVAKLDDGVIMLLDHTALLRFVGEDALHRDHTATISASQTREVCPEPSSAERSIYRERARALMHPVDDEGANGRLPLAVVGLNDEYFGVELATVREFVDLQKITPVPCCPEHIVGDMNLRGDILTVVDIRPMLQIPVVGRSAAAKVIVVPFDDGLVGVLVDRVCDVLYVHPTAVTDLSPSEQLRSGGYLKGSTPYGGRMLSIVDLRKMLMSGQWLVNEGA